MKTTVQQRRYYFGEVVHKVRLRLAELKHPLSKELVHRWLRMKFAKDKSTKDMDSGEFVEYVEKIKAYGAVILDIYIKDVNE